MPGIACLAARYNAHIRTQSFRHELGWDKIRQLVAGLWKILVVSYWLTSKSERREHCEADFNILWRKLFSFAIAQTCEIGARCAHRLDAPAGNLPLAEVPKIDQRVC